MFKYCGCKLQDKYEGKIEGEIVQRRWASSVQKRCWYHFQCCKDNHSDHLLQQSFFYLLLATNKSDCLFLGLPTKNKFCSCHTFKIYFMLANLNLYHIFLNISWFMYKPSIHSRKRRFVSFLSFFLKFSSLQFDNFFYIIRIIEVHNFRKNYRICLLEDLIQDIIRINLLSKFHSVRFSILEISVFTSFFHIIWIIEGP